MLEKPIALELWEADELIHLAKQNNLKFTIGYSQRFNTKIAYAKKKIVNGRPERSSRCWSAVTSRVHSARKLPSACGSRRW